MALIHIHNTGALGVIKDIPPHDLPLQAWSDATNIRFTGYQAEVFEGHKVAYNISVSAATNITQDIAISAVWLLNVNTGTDIYWVYAGLNKVYAATNNANQINITRQSATSTASITSTSPDNDYAASADTRWTGMVLQGVPIINNGNDPPQQWNPVSTSQRLTELLWDDSSGAKWSERTAGAVTAEVMRGYREFGVAMDVTEGGTRIPSRVRWSHPALPGSPPSTWDETRLDRLAGFQDIDDTGDIIVDALTLRDALYIYKTSSTWIMQFVGGNDVHGFRKQFLTVGALSRGCMQEFFGRHLVLTPTDLVAHDGHNVESVIDTKWRNFLFSNISSEHNKNAYLITDTSNFEVWVCYPVTGQTEPWPTQALVWNWRHNTYSVRELDSFSDIKSGVIEVVQGVTTSGPSTWDSIIELWDSSELIWTGSEFNPSNEGLLASKGTLNKLFALNNGNTFGLGSVGNIPARLERLALPLSAQDSQGQMKPDITSLKHVRAVWPHLSAASGTVIKVSVGTQTNFNSQVSWTEPFSFTAGESVRVNMGVTGRLIGVKFESTSSYGWALTGYSLDMDIVGRF